jgi:predicted ATPase
LVNISDVGFGVPQCLPAVVALLAAKPGQLLYIEQPEIHLHPRAQFALAQLLAAAAERGVHVVVETHSSTLLLGVQALVAESRLAAELVKLHWFERKADGHTVVTSADLDEAGRFGDWPEDFADVALQTQKEYLDAAEKRLFAE